MLRPDRATLEADWIAESLRTATEQAREAVERVELKPQDVEAAEEAERQRRDSVREVAALYDRWTAESRGGCCRLRDSPGSVNIVRQAGKGLV